MESDARTADSFFPLVAFFATIVCLLFSVHVDAREELTSFDKILKSLQSSVKAVQESPAVSREPIKVSFVFNLSHYNPAENTRTDVLF